MVFFDLFFYFILLSVHHHLGWLSSIFWDCRLVHYILALMTVVLILMLLTFIVSLLKQKVAYDFKVATKFDLLATYKGIGV